MSDSIKEPIELRVWDKHEQRIIRWTEIALSTSLLQEILVLRNPRYIVMRSTGVQDFAGRTIYNGDVVGILRYGSNGWYAKVDCIVWNPIEARFRFANSGTIEGCKDDEKFVLGNIFEHAHVLEMGNTELYLLLADIKRAIKPAV